jgi:hypothetical protein
VPTRPDIQISNARAGIASCPHNAAMKLRVVSWILYVVGIAMVGGSWVGLISPGVGWVGWVMGMCGWGMSFLPVYKRESLSGELQRLAQLHEAGQLTDEEFDQAKKTLL